MKKLIPLCVFGLSTLFTFSQGENSTHCYKRDFKGSPTAKSNTLSVAQIAESEKYNVHFYALDVAMNNLVTDIAGTVEIHATANAILDSALFELFQTMTITQIRVNGTPVTFSRNVSAVKCPVNAAAGQSFILSIDYNGTPPTSVTNPLGGAGMSNDNSPSWGNQVTWSLSQPFSAYEWWPCKQSLTDKADSCSVKITVPTACKAGSNGLLENVVDLGNGTSRYEWKHRNLIDYYLISVAVAQYVEYNVFANPVGSSGPVLIQNYIYDNPATLPNFQAEIDETADFIELFATLVGPYPFDNEKYGHCMAPISGGMEHQTMTTQGFFEKSLTAHELGHMWFGDHVTCASWADIWVNEGFASYLDYLMIENLYPAEKVQYMLDVHTNVMSALGGSVWVLDSLNETRIFSGRLTYDKGSSIIHTMRFILNNDTQFFQALRNYQTTFADSVAKGLDVKAALETVSGIDFTNMFNEWYFGEGYPTYSTRRNAVGNDLNFEITHTTSKPSVTPTFTNPIEIKFSRTSQADTTIRFDISGNSNQYFIPNIGAVTNVVAIDPNNWVINKVGTTITDVNFVNDINEFSLNEFITIYPNPTSGTVQIEIPKGMSHCSLKITDLNGKILKKSIVSNSTKISLEEYLAGTYLFVFEVNDSIVKIEKVQKN